MQPVPVPTPPGGTTQVPPPNVIVAGSPVVSPAQVFPERYGFAPIGVGVIPPPIYSYPPPLYPYRPLGYPMRPFPYNPFYF